LNQFCNSLYLRDDFHFTRKFTTEAICEHSPPHTPMKNRS